MAAKPKTKLERIGRDLNRTLLHGSRPEIAEGARPAAVVSGQQIAVDVPATGGLRFDFEHGGQTQQVPVTRANVVESERVMRAVIDAPARYLKLAPDPLIPTWVFHQREFTLPETPVAEDVLELTDPTRTVLRLPPQVVQEVERVGGACDVSLWRLQNGKKGEVLPATWRPAILLRFPLERVVGASPLSGDDQVLEIRGVSQGDRAFLDRLHLLPNDPETPSAEIDNVMLHLQKGRAAPRPVQNWTIARVNLTLEARPGQVMEVGLAATFPHIATQSEPEDSLRLLQMASITNSGGYFLRVASTQTPDTLVLCVVLKGKATTYPESVQIPDAANAILYAGDVSPNVARFEDQRSIRVTPFVPPGFVSFGWTRTEPVEKTTDEDRFGFGTISLVDYRVLSKSGAVLQPRESRSAISPLQALPVVATDKGEGGQTSETSGKRDSAAMKLVATHVPAPPVEAAVSTGEESATSLRYYRASHPCYGATTESPYAPLADPERREVSISPGFRDVFGNVFTAVAGADQKKQLFYTDALIPPSEWPGVEFSILPGSASGKPFIDLIATYRPAEDANSEKARHAVLEGILCQIKGALDDARVELLAAPLLATPKQITSEVGAWIAGILSGVTANLEVHCPCNATAVTVPAEFDPILRFARTNASLLPQPTHLPSGPEDKILRETIENQIRETSTRLRMIAAAVFAGGGDIETAREEFRPVAEAFHTHLSARYGLQIGFSRDEVNQHHLWLLPNALFPKVTTVSPNWSFATARPLSNRLESDTLEMPVFTRPETVAHNWLGFALQTEHFVEQDLDGLARTALSLIEREALKPELVTNTGTLAFARKALQNKERIARRLATSDGGGSYVVPLFEDPGVLNGDALTRLAKDAFLKNLEGFYSIDTFVQLPLEQGVDTSFVAMLEGKVISPFVANSDTRLPSFSDVLLKQGEDRVTVLYDVPSGMTDPNTAPQVPAGPDLMKVKFTHLQMHPLSGASADVLNRGTWLELAKAVTLAWPGLGGTVPAAIRVFPAKPVLESVATTQAALPGAALTTTDVPLLTRWGWVVVCAAEGLSTDTIHAKVRYSEPESRSNAHEAETEPPWAPTSLLHCLVVLKRLNDGWESVAMNKRLEIVAPLMEFLAGFLDQAGNNAELASDPLIDSFDLTFPSSSQLPQLAKVEFKVMDRIVVLPPPAGPETPGLRRFEVRADPNDNKASLISRTASAGPVRSMLPSLRLVRNEAIGSTRLDKRLIYECATVEAPGERVVVNMWPNSPNQQLSFKAATGETFSATLKSFFTSLFADAAFAGLGVEVGMALVCRRENLRMTTPYSIVPTDLASPSAEELAARVFEISHAFLGTSGQGSPDLVRPPDMDEAAIRLRIKVSATGGNGERRLVDIAAIDFPLV